MLDQPHAKADGAKPQQEMISGAFPRNAWYVAAWSDELDDGKLVARMFMNEPVVLFRKSNGDVAAIEDRCAHRFAPLSMGKIVGGYSSPRPYHGLEFDGSGACVHNPHGAKNIPPRARVRGYPVIEKHKAVWIWMGAAPADAGKIPDFSVLDDVPELHTTKRDSIVIKANYQLIVDNLLDLKPHLVSARGHSRQRRHRRIRDHHRAGRRRRRGRPPRHHFEAAWHVRAVWPDHPPRVQTFMKMRWMAPSALRLLTGICEIGAAPRNRHWLPRRAFGHPRDRALDALFFHRRTLGREDGRGQAQPRSAAAHRGNAALRLREQDAPVIEAQQRIIESAAEPLDPVILAVDTGCVRYKRVLGKMLEAEQG